MKNVADVESGRDNAPKAKKKFFPPTKSSLRHEEKCRGVADVESDRVICRRQRKKFLWGGRVGIKIFFFQHWSVAFN